MSKLRVFIALQISPILQQQIVQWENDFKIKEKEVFDKCRWIPPHNLHITLIPPWYMEKSGIEKLIIDLGLIAKKGISQIKLEFRQITYGPEKKHPRLIWASGKTLEQLSRLKELLENQLGFKKEKRPYQLHLTLARFRPEKFSSFSLKEINADIFWEEQVSQFVLMQSQLNPKGAEYSVLAEIKL